jgi:hypothetical protein
MKSANEIAASLLAETPLHAAERKNLPDSAFGLPKSRQFPIHDAEHVRKAVQMFRRCPRANRKELAKNIFAAAKKFNVEISDSSEVHSYL